MGRCSKLKGESSKMKMMSTRDNDFDWNTYFKSQIANRKSQIANRKSLDHSITQSPIIYAMECEQMLNDNRICFLITLSGTKFSIFVALILEESIYE